MENQRSRTVTITSVIFLYNYELLINYRIGNGATRKAYMGHLIKMANYVVELGKDGKNAPKILNLIQSLPESVQLEWQEFIDVKLSQANKNNEIIPVTVSKQTALSYLKCFRPIIIFLSSVEYGSSAFK